jgi:hypothetical protein
MIPMQSIQRDWFDWTNFAVGGVGLILTVTAIVQATGAKTAAERAQKSVQRHNAEGDFASLKQIAEELHGFVGKGSLAEARLRTTDLRSKLGAAVVQYEEFLKSDLKDLNKSRVELKLVEDGLRKSADLTPGQTDRLMKITDSTKELLASVSGKLRAIPKGELV